MAFYDNYIRLCAEKGVSPSGAAIEIGLKKSNVTYWKNNRSKPSDVTLAKIADYFSVTVDELTSDAEPPVAKDLLSEEQTRIIEKIKALNAEDFSKVSSAVEALLNIKL